MVSLTRRSVDLIDPLSCAIAPPATETAAERAAREAKEAEGRRISDLIDEQIKLERQAISRKKAPVKVLMLGQAESGAPLIIRVYFFGALMRSCYLTPFPR